MGESTDTDAAPGAQGHRHLPGAAVMIMGALCVGHVGTMRCHLFSVHFCSRSGLCCCETDARPGCGGGALAFKLQSVFFLPVLGLVSLRRGLKPAHVAITAGVWLLLSLPPVLFGRSPASTLGTYAGQASEGGMVNGAMNIYQWFPDLTGAPGKTFALILCAAVLLVLSVVYWRGADTPDRTVLLAVAVLVACPLFLPQMHDRYFFTAEVASLLLLQRRLRFVVPALLALTGSYAYFVYFTENRLLWPLMLAALIQCVAFGLLVHALIRSRPQSRGAQGALHNVHRSATPAAIVSKTPGTREH